jgi:two-component system response regulator PilR (NtrC family)
VKGPPPSTRVADADPLLPGDRDGDPVASESEEEGSGGRPRLLIVDDEAGLRGMLQVLFRRAGYEVDVAEGAGSGTRALAEASRPFDLVVTDLVMPDGSGMDVLDAARARSEATQVVMITAHARTEQAVEAMRKGAYDYLEKPFRNDVLRATVDKALEKGRIVEENRQLRAQVRRDWRRGEIVGRSVAMRRVIDLVDRVAASPASVLITGESGTGKEVVARALHHRSDRASRSFVAVNCGALPENLMESELFGHEKGAFTGATARKEGLFRAADGGTLFLDEIGELPVSLQVKLLRVLQERRVRPVGAAKEQAVDVRVLAATNQVVEEAVAEGRLRQDLFYRLNVIRIHLPPLRERREDIPLLAEHFLARHGALRGRRLSFSRGALRFLVEARWSGNARELENVVERAVTLARGDLVEAEDLLLDDVLGGPEAGTTGGHRLDGERHAPGRSPPSSVPAGSAPPSRAALEAPTRLPDEGIDLDRHLAEVERRLLLQALAQAGGVRTRAAKLVGMTFRSFRYRLAKYGISGDEG